MRNTLQYRPWDVLGALILPSRSTKKAHWLPNWPRCLPELWHLKAGSVSHNIVESILNHVPIVFPCCVKVALCSSMFQRCRKTWPDWSFTRPTSETSAPICDPVPGWIYWWWCCTCFIPYCWWNKSGDHQLRLVVYPMISRVLAPSQVVFSPDFWTINSSIACWFTGWKSCCFTGWK